MSTHKGLLDAATAGKGEGHHTVKSQLGGLGELIILRDIFRDLLRCGEVALLLLQGHDENCRGEWGPQQVRSGPEARVLFAA